MPKTPIIALGKVVRKISRLRGGGSALPGLVIEKIDPSFVRDILSQLPHGIVIVSGTNGKTTTTKIVVELLESQGLKVFTNRTGSNFVRGVIAAILSEVGLNGKLNADIAVLELDEAHAVKFVEVIPPNYCLLLNVLRDQLDRFGEIDTTAEMLHTIAQATTDGVVLNRDDPRLGSKSFIKPLKAPIRTFGVAPDLLSQFPSDEELHAAPGKPRRATFYADDTSLLATKAHTVTIGYNKQTKPVTLKLNGIYNTLNAVGAVALCRLILDGLLDEPAMLAALSNVTPAFGRGESLVVDGQPLELVLVKNPSGFRLALQSFSTTNTATMIAINDDYADGRDMSWLWDVPFDSLKPSGIHTVSGIRAYDMSLRLTYDGVSTHTVTTDLSEALDTFLTDTTDQPKRIFCTYTAMLKLRKLLTAHANVEEIS